VLVSSTISATARSAVTSVTIGIGPFLATSPSRPGSAPATSARPGRRAPPCRGTSRPAGRTSRASPRRASAAWPRFRRCTGPRPPAGARIPGRAACPVRPPPRRAGCSPRTDPAGAQHGAVGRQHRITRSTAAASPPARTRSIPASISFWPADRRVDQRDPAGPRCRVDPVQQDQARRRVGHEHGPWCHRGHKAGRAQHHLVHLGLVESSPRPRRPRPPTPRPGEHGHRRTGREEHPHHRPAHAPGSDEPDRPGPVARPALGHHGERPVQRSAPIPRAAPVMIGTLDSLTPDFPSSSIVGESDPGLAAGVHQRFLAAYQPSGSQPSVLACRCRNSQRSPTGTRTSKYRPQ
jgi:hypothetical protein